MEQPRAGLVLPRWASWDQTSSWSLSSRSLWRVSLPYMGLWSLFLSGMDVSVPLLSPSCMLMCFYSLKRVCTVSTWVTSIFLFYSESWHVSIQVSPFTLISHIIYYSVDYKNIQLAFWTSKKLGMCLRGIIIKHELHLFTDMKSVQ